MPEIPPRPASLVLDERQEAVVQWRVGAALVAAAAGAGKTAVLTERTAALLADGVLPESILLLAYNKDAAETLRKRIAARAGSLLGPRVQVYTFHAFGFAILREWFPQEMRTVRVDDGRRCWQIARSAMEGAGLTGDVSAFVNLSAALREKLVDVFDNDLTEIEAHTGVGRDGAGRILMFLRALQMSKFSQGLIDYADMVYTVARLIRQGSPIAARLRGRYKHVMVDEAQDLSPARYALAGAVGFSADSFVFVADPRQSINGFSGVDPHCIEDAATRSALLTLPVNRRSTRAIVEFGNAIARGRPWHLGGDAEAAPDAPDGSPVRTWETHTPEDEARAVVGSVQAWLDGGGTLEDGSGNARFACLVRTNAQAATLERHFFQAKIPCRVRGAKGGIWTTAQGREFLAYLYAAADKAHPALAQVANKPNRWIKRTAIDDAVTKAGGGSLITALAGAGQRASKLAEELLELGALDWRARCMAIARLFATDDRERILAQERKQGFALDDREADDGGMEMYSALALLAAGAGSLEEIEKQIGALAKASKGKAAVVISTCHSSKGQEWDTVFVCGMGENLFPHRKNSDIDEERRLFYVAATRAKRELVVSVGAPKPSFFLYDCGALTRSKGVVRRAGKNAGAAAGVVHRRKPQAVEPTDLSPDEMELVQAGRVTDAARAVVRRLKIDLPAANRLILAAAEAVGEG